MRERSASLQPPTSLSLPACMAFSFSPFQSAVRQMMLFLATQQRRRASEGVRGRKRRSVGPSVVSILILPPRDSDAAVAATAVSTLINIIKECGACCVMHEGEGLMPFPTAECRGLCLSRNDFIFFIKATVFAAGSRSGGDRHGSWLRGFTHGGG